MTAKTLKLMVFAHLGQDWKPCGQLLMTEENTEVLASSFAYGMNSLMATQIPPPMATSKSPT